MSVAPRHSLQAIRTPGENGSESADGLLPMEGLIRTVQELRHLPGTTISPFWWLTVTLVVLLLTGLLLAYWLRRQRQQQAEAVRTPYQVARAALHDIHDIRHELEPKALAGRLSSVVRRFLEDAFGLPAPERTTEEILPDLARHPVFSGSPSTLLGRFLQGCDLAKFARHAFNREEADDLFQLASDIIDQAHLRRIQKESLESATGLPETGRTAS